LQNIKAHVTLGNLMYSYGVERATKQEGHLRRLEPLHDEVDRAGEDDRADVEVARGGLAARRLVLVLAPGLGHSRA
jgi:hypothetical protein